MDYTDFSEFLKTLQDAYTAVMEEEPKSQERQPLNLRTDFGGVLDAMAAIEGPAWRTGELRISGHWDESSEGERTTSLEGARRWLGTVSPDEDAWRTVYGSFGVNRWFVHADGRVRFSRFHASPEGLRKAQEMDLWVE